MAGVRKSRSGLRDQYPPTRPLTTGNHRLSIRPLVAPLDPSPAEIAFLERVASEFAVCGQSSSPSRKLFVSRDRRSLFDAVRLHRVRSETLFSAIWPTFECDPAPLRAADAAQRGQAPMCARCIPQAPVLRRIQGAFRSPGMPAETCAATGTRGGSRHRYRPLPESGFSAVCGLGFKSICSVPLIAEMA
jgi:hypothetical protein